MQLELKDINKKEVLQYLLWRGGEIPPETDALIDACIGEVLREIRASWTWTLCSRAQAPLPGRDLREMLKDCEDYILLAVTLGGEMDKKIRIAGARDMTRSLVLDACGSAAVEAACELAEQELLKQFPGKFLTDRFSPGYGDFPLEYQRTLIQTLQTQKRIGLTLTDTCMMLPRKSVTAVIGLASKAQKKRFRGCAYCSMFERCEYRKAGKYCGRE